MKAAMEICMTQDRAGGNKEKGKICAAVGPWAPAGVHSHNHVAGCKLKDILWVDEQEKDKHTDEYGCLFDDYAPICAHKLARQTGQATGTDAGGVIPAFTLVTDLQGVDEAAVRPGAMINDVEEDQWGYHYVNYVDTEGQLVSNVRYCVPVVPTCAIVVKAGNVAAHCSSSALK